MNTAHQGDVRPAAQAGRFYPADPEELRRQIEGFLAAAKPPDLPSPKALILPHAGTVYSGPIAASGYALLARDREAIRRVILLGPNHYVPVSRIAVSGVSAFETLLGEVSVDDEARAVALGLPGCCIDDEAHAPEHSIEVHLPFLQTVLGEVTFLPLLVGQAKAEEVAAVLDVLWGGPETRFIVSSDLSHFHDHATASALDAITAERIVAAEVADFTGEDACGHRAIKGLLLAVRERGLKCSLLDLRNSGDTAGDRRRVVGYGAFSFHERT